MCGITAAITVAAIGAGASTGAAVYSAHKQGEANKEALKASTSASDKALEYEKEQDKYKRETEAERYQYGRQTEANRYGALQRQTAPYRASGVAANSRMADLLGLPAPGGEQPDPASGGMTGKFWGAPARPLTAEEQQHSFGPSPGGAVPPAASPQPNQMVTMRAPDGTTKQVPADQEQHYTQKGAQRVG